LTLKQKKNIFREFYESNHQLLEDAKDSFITLLNALVSHAGNTPISKLEGRVKEKEECIRKFNRKYRTNLESESTLYSIKDHISDLIGLRIVCLYEDDIEKIKKIINEHFMIIDMTDKISQIENTESSFGYKGLHFDLKLANNRKNLPEYSSYADFSFEVQIRTIIQDSWSVLDHKIKYKKSIPNSLKRRINTLAALFELADREFREIRDATTEEIIREESSADDLYEEHDNTSESEVPIKYHEIKLNAFSFLKISKHFFNGYEFEPHKVDGFTQEIVSYEPKISRGKFNFYMRENISKVKRYQEEYEFNNPNDKLNPYIIIRHCLYLGNKETFSTILTNIAKESFEAWLIEHNSTT
jgi:ppGpp synthetase/RelA/SpoT-type nucleotidyltranferase